MLGIRKTAPPCSKLRVSRLTHPGARDSIQRPISSRPARAMTMAPIVSKGPANILDLVGNTPLIHLASLSRETPGVELYAKAEWVNPGGSVKDRAALMIVQEAERSGELTRDKILLDATSGNTGIAYAWLGAARGFQVKLCMP